MLLGLIGKQVFYVQSMASIRKALLKKRLVEI